MDVDQQQEDQQQEAYLDSMEQEVLQDTQLDAGGVHDAEHGTRAAAPSGEEIEGQEGEGDGPTSTGSTEGQGRRQSDLKHWLL